MSGCIPAFAGPLLRTFVCVKLPQSHITALGSWIEAKKRETREAGIRWVKPETIHITLKFCGEIPPEMARAVSSLLDKELPRGAFELSARGVGGFPKLSAPRVIWTGIAGDTEKLAKLARAADDLAARRGVAKERKKFSPHITLGRRGEAAPLSAEALRSLESGGPDLPPWTVREVIFMRSELTPSGPIYTPLKIYAL